MAQSIQDAKRCMRQELRTQCLPPTPEENAALVTHLRTALLECPALHTVATFAALPDEPAILSLTTTLPDRRWVLPVVIGDDLEFRAISDPHLDLQAGAFGILEPQSSCPVVRTEEIDLFLCPGMAFDQTGARLGRGRGFYDRLLACAREGTSLWGITLSQRVKAAVPREPHDLAMHAVLTEQGWLKRP